MTEGGSIIIAIGVSNLRQNRVVVGDALTKSDALHGRS